MHVHANSGLCINKRTCRIIQKSVGKNDATGSKVRVYDKIGHHSSQHQKYGIII